VGVEAYILAMSWKLWPQFWKHFGW